MHASYTASESCLYGVIEKNVGSPLISHYWSESIKFFRGYSFGDKFLALPAMSIAMSGPRV